MMRKKIIKKVVAILIVVTLLMPSASQVYAADPINGVKVNADNSKLDRASKNARDSVAEVTQGDT